VSSSLNLRTDQTWAAGKRFRSRSPGFRGLFTVVILAALVCGFLWYIGVFGGNVRTVTPGLVYRSAQLTGANLDDVLAADNIKTDINLRGGSTAQSWYRSELASCAHFGVTHIDITLSARRLPELSQLARLLDAFDHSQYPILYHCQAGSDRSGLVGTLYLNIYQHVPLITAEHRELTWRYGHFSFGQTHAMDDFFRLYRRTSHGQDLRDWITTTYPALYNASHRGHA
jgi:hypothetical protein